MKIEVNAKILLTIHKPTTGTTPEDFVLEAEQHLNEVPLLYSNASCVGIRIHMNGESLKVTQ